MGSGLAAYWTKAQIADIVLAWNRQAVGGNVLFNRVIDNIQTLLQELFPQALKSTPDSRFVDLAPTSNADNAGIYFAALDFATTNDEVLNIALTGPYGSGKSSVIKTFLSRYPGTTLQLSLASFLPDGGKPGHVSKQEIERSILQQILYGVDADKLPFSRFKRIRTPKRFSLGTSLLITIGLACAWYLLSKQADVISGALFKPAQLSNWFNYFCIVAVGALAWKAVHGACVNSLGLSLKSISLKDVQIAPAAADQESILNRHLDEILYFFQSTSYDLVVIEDLDRFENPDIFVTLREINGLINANEAIKRRVRFLYALRDDIFSNTDRTKFFEFIVPVLPVINHSNSIDKVIEHSQRIALDARLSKQFVREVSRYLSDLRLIGNIFNEYVVYSTNLAADQDNLLDANKLLAILIYKNVMPRDFAALHRQEGALSQVFGRYDDYVAKIEREIRSEISAIETRLETGDQQALKDEAELRKVYAMAIIERIPHSYTVVVTAEGNFQLGQLTTGDLLESLFTQKSVRVLHDGYSQRTVDLREVEGAVDPTRSFEQRKSEISGKSAKVRQESEKRISQLETKISSLRTRRFNEVVRESSDLIEQIFTEVGESSDLLKYLVLEGYLDDTYYQYISLFYSGRLSPRDNSFLIKIRAYNNPPPDCPLDNVAEVVASMRPEDFGQAYVLNRFIMDHLLADATLHSQQVAEAIGFIAANFQSCSDFFRSYYATGSHVDKLVSALTAEWPSFGSVALYETDAPSHAARILAFASDQAFQLPAFKHPLRTFLSDNADRVLAEQVGFRLDRFRSLAVEVNEVEKLADYPEALSFVAEQGLYRISIDNIRYIFGHVGDENRLDTLEKRHLSSLKETNDAALLKRITSDFPTYVRDVLLTLQTNTEEDFSAILQVLARDDIEHSLRAEFLQKQTSLLPQLNDIPAEFQHIALERHRVEPTWENCLQFMKSESYDADVLTTYLQSDKASAALIQQPIPVGDKALTLRQFVIGNDALALDIYRSYVRLLPNYFKNFQNVDNTKTKILIEEGKVAFTPANFQHLDDVNLQVLFIALNFDTYVAAKSEYSMHEEFRDKLICSSISDPQKLNVLADIDESYVAGTPSLAAIVGPLIDRSTGARLDYGVQFIKAIILNSREIQVQVSLLNKMHQALSLSEVRDILRGLPAPFQDIARFGKAPKLENNEGNRQLAQWLAERKVISSFKETVITGEFKINTFRRDG